MRYLLDTHIVIWLAREPEKLSSSIRQILEDKNNTIYFSSINLWEIAIKSSLQKTDFNFDVIRLKSQLLTHDFKELIVSSEYIPHIANLPFYHKDPFDRMLIAQAIAKDLCLISRDTQITAYPNLKLLSK